MPAHAAGTAEQSVRENAKELFFKDKMQNGRGRSDAKRRIGCHAKFEAKRMRDTRFGGCLALQFRIILNYRCCPNELSHW